MRNKRKETARRGSAFVIVIGMLTVMIVMGVAFSTFIRTEQAGSTSLKNSLVARQSLNTAIGRVMDAIDLSFGDVSNKWPVCVWPNAWLASSPDEAKDYYQSAVRPETRSTDSGEARIVTKEIADLLTPAQLALARSARCEWAPIYASIETGNELEADGGQYGIMGQDSADSVVGRYAFIALETTGLLGANDVGDPDATLADRQASGGQDPSLYVIPAATEASGGVDVTGLGKLPTLVTDASKYLAARKNKAKRKTSSYSYPLGYFGSFAEMRAAGTNSFLHSIAKPDGLKAVKNSLNGADLSKAYIPADLFATFAPSLSSFSPEGNPKTPFIPTNSLDSAKAVEAFATDAHRNMVQVFAHSREAANKGLTDADLDTITLYERVSSPLKLSRARLATVAAIDYGDLDSTPGRNIRASVNYWDLLKRESRTVPVVPFDGGALEEVTDPGTGTYTDDPLNFPVTEPVPCVSWAYAFVDTDSFTVTTNDTAQNPEDWKVVYSLPIQVGAIAQSPNVVSDSKFTKKEFQLKMEYETMDCIPATGSVSADSRSAADDLEEGLLNYTGEATIVEGGTTTKIPGQKVTWKNLFKSGSKTSEWKSVDDGSDVALNRLLAVSDSWNVTVECPLKSYEEVRVGRVTKEDVEYFPMTRAEFEKIAADVFVPVRMKLTVSCKDVGGETVVQQVPAPRLESSNRKGYWLRLNMGVWHDWAGTTGKASDYRGTEGDGGGRQGHGHGSVTFETGFAPGWAFCMAPQFACDTTSLVTDKNTNPRNLKNGLSTQATANQKSAFWLNDNIARNEAAPNGSPFEKMCEALVTLLDPTDEATGENGGVEIETPERRGKAAIFNYVQANYLLSRDSASLYHSFVMPGLEILPDGFHSEASDGTPFCQDGNVFATALVNNDFRTHIPNRPITSVGELGRVMCGPYETLSLFKTFRNGDLNGSKKGSDFHRVLDYFGGGATPRDERPEHPYYAPVSAGRVNLNAPSMVRWNNDKGTRATTDGCPLNPFPIVAALTGAPVLTSDPSVSFNQQDAARVASEILLHAGNKLKNEDGFPSGANASRRVFRAVSDIGNCDDDANYVLDTVFQVASAKGKEPKSDADREAFIVNSAEAFTTRGQTFLVIIRADAYTPRYGEESAKDGEGTTLASTHAVLELFRDPEFACYPDGSPLRQNGAIGKRSDIKNPAYFFHNWYIKSMRVF